MWQIFYWILLLSGGAAAVGNSCLWGWSAARNCFDSSIFGSLSNTQRVSACWNGSFGLLSWNTKSRVCEECGTALASCSKGGPHPWVSLLGPPTHLAEAASFRGQRMTPKCAKFLFLDQISRLYWNHSMQRRLMFECIVSLYVVCLFYEWSQEKLSWQCFLKKTIQQGLLLVFFYRFCIYLSIFFSH